MLQHAGFPETMVHLGHTQATGGPHQGLQPSEYCSLSDVAS